MLPHRLFNWHPVLMVLAFAVFMSEAVLAYKVPWSASFSRYAAACGMCSNGKAQRQRGGDCFCSQQQQQQLVQMPQQQQQQMVPIGRSWCSKILRTAA